MTTTTSVINIQDYTTKFETYPADLIVFSQEHNFKLLPLTTLRGQALALMAQPEVRGQKHISRNEADQFFKNIHLETSDAIQQFNKAFGLKRMKLPRCHYCLEYPFDLDTTDLDKRKGATISGDKDTQVNAVKDWWRKNLIDAPNSEWQIGHLDPTIDDASEKNLAFQPPIQGRYRDRFKFDETFLKMWPTAEVELIPKFDKYYTEKEQRAIYEALKLKFNEQ
jgi:hypothetical protein